MPHMICTNFRRQLGHKSCERFLLCSSMCMLLQKNKSFTFIMINMIEYLKKKKNIFLIELPEIILRQSVNVCQGLF